MVANLVGSWIDLYELMQLHAAGRIVLKTETHPLDAVNDVLAKLREGEVTGRAVLVPWLSRPACAARLRRRASAGGLAFLSGPRSCAIRGPASSLPWRRTPP